jgi:hypothetical protein
MVINKLAKLLIAPAAVFGLHYQAVAQMDMQRIRGTVENRNLTIELKPITSLLSVAPGVGALGIAGEGLITENVTAFVGANFLSGDIPGWTQREMRAVADGLAVDRADGFTVYAGGRWYNNPQAHSWYAGGQIAYAAANATWNYADETIESTVASIPPGVNGGYRWLWDNGVLVRVGATASANLLLEESVTATATTQAVQDIQADISDVQRFPVLANLDFGLGYVF